MMFRWSTAKLLVVLGGLALAVITSLVVTSPKPFFYDEPHYLNQVGYLRYYGLSWKMLDEWPGQTGPTFALLHTLTEPATHLEPTPSRLLNTLLAALTALALALAVRQNFPATRHPLSLGAAFLLLPVVWPIAGLALTEMTSVLALVIGLACLGCLIGKKRRLATTLAIATLGGLAFGTALVGRQMLVPALAVPISLLALRRDRWIPCTVFLGFALVLPLLVFGRWSSLSPPLMQAANMWREERGEARALLEPTHALLSYGYAMLLTLLVAPGLILKTPRGILALGLVGGVSLSMAVGFEQYLPARSLVESVLPKQQIPLMGKLGALSLAILGSTFIAAVGWNAIRSPNWRVRVPYAIGLGLCLGVPIAIVHTFSTRYIAVSSPLLLLFLAPLWKANWGAVVRGALSLILGAGILFHWLHRGDQNYAQDYWTELFYPHLFWNHGEQQWSLDRWRALHENVGRSIPPVSDRPLPPLPRR